LTGYEGSTVALPHHEGSGGHGGTKHFCVSLQRAATAVVTQAILARVDDRSRGPDLIKIVRGRKRWAPPGTYHHSRYAFAVFPSFTQLRSATASGLNHEPPAVKSSETHIVIVRSAAEGT
jgi:hypothetical protein